MSSAEQAQIADDNIVTLFMHGLNPSVTQHDLIEYFSKFGELTEGVMMLDKNGQSRGFGFITFSSSQAVRECLESRPHFIH